MVMEGKTLTEKPQQVIYRSTRLNKPKKLKQRKNKSQLIYFRLKLQLHLAYATSF